jgi:outer membrane murein-binding lipoprotein Lpp
MALLSNTTVYGTLSGSGIIYDLTSNSLIWASGYSLASGINTQTGNYATITNLASTGSTLDTKINTLSGSSVLLYGNQTISGLKDFTTRPTVNTTPVLLSGENAHGLTVLVKNDDSVTLNKGQPVYIYGANGDNILVRRAMNTGEATSSKTLGLLNQSLAPNAQGLVVTEGSLEGINTNAGNAGDPIWLGPTGDLIFGLAQKPYAPNHLVYLGVIERKQINNGKIYVKVQNGFELQELHNVNIDHKNALNDSDILRYNSASGLWFNETLNTGIFQTQINSLSGSSVLLYGNQSIGGVKTFRDNVYINNLFVTGTETIVSTNNFNVQSPYLILNLTGGAVDGGIFFVTGSGLTGINDTGPIIGFDHSNKFKFGVSTRNSDHSTLPDIASVQDIQAYSGVADNKFSTIINLAGTGSTLQTNINTVSSNLVSTGNNLEGKISSLSGTLTSNYATITNLATTGSTLNTNINNLSGYINSSSSNIVFTTGNQTISGVKTFRNIISVTNISGLSGVGGPTSIDIKGMDNAYNVFGTSFIGGHVNITAGSGNIAGGNINLYAGKFGTTAYGGNINAIASNIYINDDNTAARNITIYKTGASVTSANISIGQTSVNVDNTFRISGVVVTPSLYATSTDLTSTGSTLQSNINNLSGYINSTNSNIVFTTGNQTISGTKTFIQDTTFGDSAQGDFLVISGNQFTVYGSGNFTSGLFVNGNAVLTGVNLSAYATVANLASTGSTLNTKINNLSGYVDIRTPQNKNFKYSAAVTGGGNTSTTIAYGANCTLTPKYVGTLRADACISMTAPNVLSSDTQQATSFWYGTGTAPVYSGNLVNLGGTRIGGLKGVGTQGSIYAISASWVAEITGLKTGTQYWFDIGISGLRQRAQDVQIYIEEKY